MTSNGQADDAGFVSRWARRKAQARSGVAAPEIVPAAAPIAVAPAEPVVAPPAEAPAAAPLPTLADVAQLTRDSDYTRFVAGGVDEGVKRAALKKLFADPHFNLMDGLDTYIDDYSQPDPIPIAMLRRMNQSTFLKLFDDDQETAKADKIVTPATESPSPPDDHADLRLQQDDAVGQPGPDQGAGA